MTAKEFVLQEYPKATHIRQHNEGCPYWWTVWNDGKLLGTGLTKPAAYTNAKQNIKEQDLSINPNE